MALPRFAIVGTGNMAATMATLLRKSDVPLTAVASLSPERAAVFAKMFNIAAGKSDLESVLERSDVDAVYVANAPSEHAATVIAALRSGKAVLCEKPMATNEADLINILQAAKQSNVLCMEALWTLHLPSYRRFQDFANSGIWGTPRSLNASFGYPTSEIETQRTNSANRGGVLLDRSIYLVALALSVLGPVMQVNAQLNLSSSGIDIEAMLQLKHANGTHSHLASSFTCLMPNTASLHCSKGLIEINTPLIGSESLSTRAAPKPYDSRFAVGPRTLSKVLKNKLRESPRIRLIKRVLDRPVTHYLKFGSDRYQPQLAHFLVLLETEKKQSDIVPLTLSHEVIRIIDKAKTLVIG